MKYLSFTLILLTALAFGSCNTEAAEKIADDFHAKLDEKDYDYIVDNLADKEGTTTEDEWRSFFDIVASWGPQHNREKKSGFNKQIKNGISTVKLSYTFEVDEFGLMHERIILINRDDSYKIMTILMNQDEQVVIEGSANF